MGANSSKANIPRSHSSTSSFGRLSIASPTNKRYSPGSQRKVLNQLEGSPTTGRNLGLARKTSLSSLDHLHEQTLLLPPREPQKMYTEEIVQHSSSLFEPGEDPALLHWLMPALFCALAYALYNIFIKKGSASIHPILGGVILQFIAAVLGSVLCLTLVYGPTKEEMFYDNKGIMFALLAGISVGVAEIVSFIVSGMGVPAMKSIPIIIGGSVMFGCVLGKLFLGEALSVRGWLGVLMIAGGISLVGMDSEGTAA